MKSQGGNGRGVWVLGLVCLLTVAGCAGGSRSASASGGPQFPSRADLSEIMRRPQKADRVEQHKTVAVDDWQPLAAEQEPSSDAEARILRIADAKRQRLAINAQLSCTAREVAGFFAQHQAFPDQQLQAHMAGVCGATQAKLGVIVWSTPAETVADSARLSEWHAGITKQLSEWLPATANLGGAAQLADAKNTLFAAAVAVESITWEKVSTLADADGRVELVGSMRTPALSFTA